jgi:tetratricopeptide (TPR) repeat protein
MVLPAPAADDQQDPPVAPWVERIARAFRRIDRGVIVLVDGASNALLGELVRGLTVEHPDLDVFTEAPRIEEIGRGSFAVLAARAKDALWLNYTRPIFHERQIKIVLWSTTEVTATLAKEAPDFLDWASRRFECPSGAPRHAIFGLRSALCARAPGVRWRGPGLKPSFEAAFPGRPLVSLRADLPYESLVDAARNAPRGWISWSELCSERDLYRVRWAMAEAGRRGRVLLDAPPVVHHDSRSPVKDYWLVHGQLMNLPYARKILGDAGVETPGRLAALLDLEPEAIHLAVALLNAGMGSAALEKAVRESRDSGATVARLARRHECALAIGGFDAMPPVRRAFVADRNARELGANGRGEALARLRECASDPPTSPEEVEPLLRTGSISPQRWDALIAAARSIHAHDVAVHWASRGSGAVGAAASRGIFECILVANIALGHRDLDAAIRAVEEIDDEDALLDDGEDRGARAPYRYADAMLRVAQAALAAGRVSQAARLFERLAYRADRMKIPWIRGSFTHDAIEGLLGSQKLLMQLDPTAGERWFEESLSRMPEHQREAIAAHAEADALVAQGRFSDAEEALRAAITRHVVHLKDPLAMSRTLTRLADMLAAQGRHAEAEPHAETALRLALDAGGPSPREVALALRRLAGSRAVLGRPDARETAQQALDALRAAFGADHPARREAEPHLQRILGIFG